MRSLDKIPPLLRPNRGHSRRSINASAIGCGVVLWLFTALACYLFARWYWGAL